MSQACFPDPFKAKGSWFKGNLHTHTTNSDGALNIEQVCSLYMSKGYDFLFITDHGKVTDVKEVATSEDFLVFQGVELGVGQSEAGTEFHVVGLNVSKLVECDDPQSAVDAVVNDGGEALIGHPYWSSLTLNDLLRLEGHLGIEIFNTTCHFSVAKGYSTTHWDDLLVRDRYSFGFAVDDAHYHFNLHRPVDACYAWIMAKAESLTAEHLMASLRKGLFYSSNGPAIFDVAVESKSIRVYCSRARAISFITRNGRGERFTATDVLLTEAEYKLRGNERYLRIEVEDEQQRTAWTNPILFNIT